MIKKILLIFITFTFFSCERDDICIDPTTPKLIILFYDSVNQIEKKAVPNLTVEVESLEGFTPINITSNDSIVIPLRIDTDLTKIKLSKQENGLDQVTDEFILNYTRGEVFVSRSCGFKTIYSEMSEENLTTHWINFLTINNQNVADEKAKHISIFH